MKIVLSKKKRFYFLKNLFLRHWGGGKHAGDSLPFFYVLSTTDQFNKTSLDYFDKRPEQCEFWKPSKFFFRWLSSSGHGEFGFRNTGWNLFNQKWKKIIFGHSSKTFRSRCSSGCVKCTFGKPAEFLSVRVRKQYNLFEILQPKMFFRTCRMQS